MKSDVLHFHPRSDRVRIIVFHLCYQIEAVSLNQRMKGVMVIMLLRLIKSNSAKGWLVWLGPHLKEKKKREGCSKCQNLEVYSTNPCDTITLCWAPYIVVFFETWMHLCNLYLSVVYGQGWVLPQRRGPTRARTWVLCSHLRALSCAKNWVDFLFHKKDEALHKLS
jgi:hypothetical protein